MKHPYQFLEDQGMEKMELATKIYLERTAHRSKRTYQPFQPVGFSIGMGTRVGGATGRRPWFPHPQEARECCADLTGGYGTGRMYKWPWHFHRHCRTLKHVAMLIGVDPKELAKAVGKKRKNPARCVECPRFRAMDDYLCGTCREALDSLLPEE